MAFFIPSIQFFFGLSHDLFCLGIHFNAILGSLSSAILCTYAIYQIFKSKIFQIIFQKGH